VLRPPVQAEESAEGRCMTEWRVKDLSEASDRKRRFLLVVDSDNDSLSYTSTLLKRFEYQTSTAGTGKEAFQTATVSVPSLIIVSLNLKDMPGLELIRELKKNPSTAIIPFITLRRSGDLPGERLSLELGAADCLYQPVSAERLYQAVQEATETRPRACIRLRTTRRVKVEGPLFDGAEDVCTLDLSERGMFLRTAGPAPANTRLAMHLDLDGRQIPVESIVVYSYRTAGGPHLQPGMGLVFVHISPGDQALIRQFVKTEVTRGIAPGQV
jgi:CheY-like chemotaxis protein